MANEWLLKFCRGLLPELLVNLVCFCVTVCVGSITRISVKLFFLHACIFVIRGNSVSVCMLSRM